MQKECSKGSSETGEMCNVARILYFYMHRIQVQKKTQGAIDSGPMNGWACVFDW